MFPIKKAIPFEDPIQYFQGIASQPFAMLLDSSSQHADLGRYSFIGFDPFMTVTSKNKDVYLNQTHVAGSPFDILNTLLSDYPLPTLAGCPPFQGGMMGLFGYDACHHIEILPRAEKDDMAFLDVAVGLYDVVLAFDLEEKKAWIFSSGYPEKSAQLRRKRADERMHVVLQILNDAKKKPFIASDAVVLQKDISSPFTKNTYAKAVGKFIDYIFAGDIFESTMSQRFTAPMPDLTPFQLYHRLRQVNPAPFSAFLNLSDQVIASASPERFLKLNAKQVETRPIKGTARRSSHPEEDATLAENLSKSEKDWAENVMIVDLMRNDLSRVCVDHSVRVPQLCGVETYATVHHLVSIVEGQLCPQYQAIDLLRATFPGGSVTGAPKIRAMEIIAECEPTARGPYCGSIGYIGFNGDMDTSIVIRTFAIKDDIVTFQVGGAIVADSDPEGEYEESLVKASAMMKTLTETQS